METRRKVNHCKSKTKDGKSCRAAATEGGLCFFHANPNKASELGRKGGRSRRQRIPDAEMVLPTLESAKAMRDFVARLTDEVYTGKTHPSVARGLAPLLQLQLRVLHATDLEARVAKLEQESKSDEGAPAARGTEGGSSQ